MKKYLLLLGLLLSACGSSPSETPAVSAVSTPYPRHVRAIIHLTVHPEKFDGGSYGIGFTVKGLSGANLAGPLPDYKSLSTIDPAIGGFKGSADCADGTKAIIFLWGDTATEMEYAIEGEASGPLELAEVDMAPEEVFTITIKEVAPW